MRRGVHGAAGGDGGQQAGVESAAAAGAPVRRHARAPASGPQEQRAHHVVQYARCCRCSLATRVAALLAAQSIGVSCHYVQFNEDEEQNPATPFVI